MAKAYKFKPGDIVEAKFFPQTNYNNNAPYVVMNRRKGLFGNDMFVCILFHNGGASEGFWFPESYFHQPKTEAKPFGNKDYSIPGIAKE